MAASDRPRRSTAGRNISKLIEQEEIGDEFYSTAYGGFQEASGDEEYESEEETEDIFDSDFDASEKEESEHEEPLPQPPKKKKKWMKYNPKNAARTKVPTVPREKKQQQTSALIQKSIEPYEPRTFRKSTVTLSQEREKNRLEELKRKQRLQRKSQSTPKGAQKQMTQEQLLEEAKWTEIENLASLEAYTRLEAQKKSFKTKDHSIAGPVIRYHSITMPVLASDGTKTSERYSRNFLVFTDTNSIPDSVFSSEHPQRPKRLYCKVTGLPAKYIDPLTGFPYSTAQAFRVIRDRFVKEKEEKCDQRLQQLSGWLEEKKRLKKQSR